MNIIAFFYNTRIIPYFYQKVKGKILTLKIFCGNIRFHKMTKRGERFSLPPAPIVYLDNHIIPLPPYMKNSFPIKSYLYSPFPSLHYIFSKQPLKFLLRTYTKVT